MYITTNLAAVVVVDSTIPYIHSDRRRPLNLVSSNMIFHHSYTQFTIMFSLNAQMPSFSSKKTIKVSLEMSLTSKRKDIVITA